MITEDDTAEFKISWETGPLVSRPGFGFYPDSVWNWLDKTTEDRGEELGLDLSNFSIARKDEFRCSVLSEYWVLLFPQLEDADVPPCFPYWDGASCIPPTLEGETAVWPCMEMYGDKYYTTYNNATRGCLTDGVWATLTNYTTCAELPGPPDTVDVEISITVYLVGYSISLIALFIAVCIFLFLREMRCMRHKIHIGLFLTYIFTDLAWIITNLLQNLVVEQGDDQTSFILWCLVRNLLSYFHLTTFFWMFLEGLYLFLQVQVPLSLANIKHKHFLLFGWGFPGLVIILWGLMRYYLPGFPQQDEEVQTSGKEGHQVYNCPFYREHPVDFLAYSVPVFTLLICNTFFLVWIMVIVVSKLRAQTVMEYDRKHWKAAKALIVVIPLLGVTYLLTLMGPDMEHYPTGYLIFQFIRAVFLSTQGFVITLPYCFLNSEVRGVLMTRWNRWQLIRSVGVDSMRTSMACSTYFSQVENKNIERGRGKLLEVPLHHQGLTSTSTSRMQSFTEINTIGGDAL
ncbi:diuretic hormone receptor isoform X2 [Eurytemora carolleeae]|uniref:diuretic hormone receptor isoform X2 n=1 Tax=Eurytemora carolleeae TaxID=1294199 RepID=UPI000C7940C8|nr:diuretic hormone receptor isoform X2 [Eurytemora carolleeae]|eukprot:XP_023329104.1 diuretic hormone receptor-like isoform X2 [Eurytemora affinis]